MHSSKLQKMFKFVNKKGCTMKQRKWLVMQFSCQSVYLKAPLCNRSCIYHKYLKKCQVLKLNSHQRGFARSARVPWSHSTCNIFTVGILHQNMSSINVFTFLRTHSDGCVLSIWKTKHTAGLTKTKLRSLI